MASTFPLGHAPNPWVEFFIMIIFSWYGSRAFCIYFQTDSNLASHLFAFAGTTVPGSDAPPRLLRNCSSTVHCRVYLPESCDLLFGAFRSQEFVQITPRCTFLFFLSFLSSWDSGDDDSSSDKDIWLPLSLHQPQSLNPYIARSTHKHFWFC